MIDQAVGTSAYTPQACGAEPDTALTDAAVNSWLYQLFTLRLTPRTHIRLDMGGDHTYTSAPLPQQPPTHPHALYLTDSRGRYRLLAFDLDAHRHGPDAVVLTDLARLRQWLSERAIPHVVARSGSLGSRHVWVGVPHGASAELVARLARALSPWLPTLDTSPLTNPRTGCVRPPGAHHRSGTSSTLDPVTHGVQGTTSVPQMHTAAAALERGTTADVLHELLTTLQISDASTAPANGETSDSAPSTITTDEAGALRLTGTVRDIGEGTLRRLAEPAPDGDYSAHAHSILLGLALARLRLEDAAALVTTTANTGLEHFRSRAESRHRLPRTAAETHTLLDRQWNRAVAAAANLPDNPPQPDTNTTEVTETVAATQAAADAVPWRWAGRSGPADRAALDTLCRQILEAGRLDVALDVRRWAQAAGHSRSAIARAVHRLSIPDDTGHAWILQEHPGDRTHAATWRVVRLVDQSGTQGSPAPRLHEGSPEAEQDPVDLTGTEVSVVDESDEPEGTALEEGNLRERLDQRLEHASHDVWTYGKGLGHHVERTRWALLTGLSTIIDLVRATGYGVERIRRHLDILRHWGLSLVSGGGAVACGNLSTAAAHLGVLGRGAERADEHVIDRIVRDWWDEEERWRRRPGKRRRGAAPGPLQSLLPVIVVNSWRQRLGRFPTRSDGRADYSAARALTREAIPGRVAASAA